MLWLYRETADLGEEIEREWVKTTLLLGGDQFIDVLGQCSESQVRASVLEAERRRRKR